MSLFRLYDNLKGDMFANLLKRAGTTPWSDCRGDTLDGGSGSTRRLLRSNASVDVT
jgi:hypothetical protein